MNTRPLHRMRAALIALCCLWPIGASATDHDLETRLKAAYIYNFAKFVEWPNAGPSVDICVFYDDNMETALRESLAGKQVAGKPVVVQDIKSIASDTLCSILVVGDETSGSDVRTGLRSIGNSAVLTVSDRENFIDDGGAIRFKLVNKKLRFEISLGATQRAGLKVSSKLLRVADVIPAE